METLRFAPLIRVSTEKQKRKGESLTTQLTQIKQYVNLLKGTIPKHCMIYQGQEHATAGQERALLDKLLADSSKGLFDAVIVTDASRWSRDNLKSEEGLNVLAKNGIRFFVSMMEYDLHNPEHRFILGMSTQINQLQASKQAIISINNRIERAKRNIPSAGLWPHGRIFNKETEKWSIDEDKKLIVEAAAKRYLEGKLKPNGKPEGIPDIAKSIGMNAANLHRILTKFSGTKIPLKFRNKSFNINETVVIEVPELLDEDTIKAIKEKIKRNTCYTIGNTKHSYLLQGNIYCEKCGYSMSAIHKPSGREYYYHSKNNKECEFHNYVPARELENAVLLDLVKTFGDYEAIERAVQRANPNSDQTTKLEKEKELLKGNIAKYQKQKNNLLDAVADGLFTNAEVVAKKNKIDEAERSALIRINTIDNELDHLPKPKDVKNLSRWAGKVIGSLTKNNPRFIFEKSFEWKKKLITKAFSGSDVEGKKLGVYVDSTGVKGEYQYKIKGLLDETVNLLPLSDYYLIDTFRLDPEFMDIEKELADVRSHISGEHPLHPT